MWTLSVTACNRLFGGVSIVLLVALGTPGCGGNGAPSRDSGSEAKLIDLAVGEYRNVAIGDTRQAMETALGPNEPAGANEDVHPLESDPDRYRGPVVIQLDPDPAEPHTPDTAPRFRYEDATVFFVEDRVRGIMVTSPDATTSEGVGIGDSLSLAEQSLDLRCFQALEGTEYEPYPACYGKVAENRYVWFGGDPIENIMVAAQPLGDD